MFIGLESAVPTSVSVIRRRLAGPAASLRFASKYRAPVRISRSASVNPWPMRWGVRVASDRTPGKFGWVERSRSIEAATVLSSESASVSGLIVRQALRVPKEANTQVKQKSRREDFMAGCCENRWRLSTEFVRFLAPVARAPCLVGPRKWTEMAAPFRRPIGYFPTLQFDQTKGRASSVVLAGAGVF